MLEQLSVAFSVYQGLARRRAHAISRKELDGAIESAKRLITHLRTLPIDVQAELGIVVRRKPNALRDLIARARLIRKRLPRKGGRPRREAFDSLLFDIADQCRSAFGRQGITYSGTADACGGERYSGPLLDFAEDLLLIKRYRLRWALRTRQAPAQGAQVMRHVGPTPGGSDG